MNAQEFEKVFEAQASYCKKLLVDKAAEYAGEDRLSAFKEAAVIQETTPRQALAGMMAKHTQSVYKFCRSGELMPLDKWQEKITDHINYLILLRALVEEETQEKKTVVNEPAGTVPITPKTLSAKTAPYNKGGCGPTGPRLVNDYANLLHQGKLRAKREARNERQEDVARSIGVHMSVVSCWELGKAQPTQEHYDALVRYFYPYWHKAVQKGLPHGQNTNKSAEPCGSERG